MKAKITSFSSNAQQPQNKEMVSAWSVVTEYKNELREIITYRAYMGRSNQASVVHACLWVRTSSGEWTSGKGQAGGYGYHKESAALQEAITSAGIELYGSAYSGNNSDLKTRCYIDGVGESAMRDALQAIAKAAGYRGKTLLITH